MKKNLLFCLLLVAFSFPQANTLSVAINGKPLPANAEITAQKASKGISITARIPVENGRFNVLEIVIPNVSKGRHDITTESKEKITYRTIEGEFYNSQNHSSTMGHIQVLESTNKNLKIEFECTINVGKTLKLSKGKASVEF